MDQESTKINRKELPFILGFLEHRDGAMAATTSGPVDQIDACDAD